MIRNRVIACAAAVTIMTAAATAADPRVEVLRAQIRTVRIQAPAVVKAVRDRYDLIIRREKLSETVLKQQRQALKAEENELLGLAANEEQAAAVRLRYERLRKYLAGEIKLDEAEIKQVLQTRELHVRQVRAAFQVKLKTLEYELNVLQRPTHGGKR